MVAIARDRYRALSLIFLIVVILVPVVLYPLPPVIDYPNHLARFWLIEGGVHVPPIDKFYFEDWRHVGSGIGIDLLAKTATGLIPPFTVGSILLTLSMLLPPLGAIALNARLFRGLNSWQPFFLLLWCSQTMIAGFLNFQIGLGAALLAAAADHAMKRRGSWAHHCGRIWIAAILFVIHPFALLYYAGLLSGLAIGNEVGSLHDIQARLRQAALPIVECLLPAALYFLRFQTVPGIKNTTYPPVSFDSFFGQLHAMASPFTSYDVRIDLLLALPFAVLVLFGLATRKFSAHRGILGVAGAFAVIALVMPSSIGHTGWMNMRLPLMAALGALSATRLDFGGKQDVRLLATGVVLVVLRTTWIGLNWSASVPMIDALRQVLAYVPPGAKILPMQHKNLERAGFFNVLGRTTATFDETFRHYPLLAIPWRHAFVPTLFAQYREKPILVRPPYDMIANQTGGVLMSVHDLLSRHPANVHAKFMWHWRDDYDYVLVLNADRTDIHGPFVPPPELRLVADSGFAELYRVLKTPAGKAH